ncbi:hypothetical protein JFN94_16780 [Burkholderia anthina]|uniref:Uncharacterized protein n=1 Tax=Burkholderia anthina TaxID=179879 RepID=A0A7T6VMW0_9BURK|nr:hypothetical protein [Burkholderia anthina]QQK06859.1 hypothetical protein JFN94_16780 [Burkholderia anthina]
MLRHVDGFDGGLQIGNVHGRTLFVSDVVSCRHAIGIEVPGIECAAMHSRSLWNGRRRDAGKRGACLRPR